MDRGLPDGNTVKAALALADDPARYAPPVAPEEAADHRSTRWNSVEK